VSIQITRTELSDGGTTHQHIVRLSWTEPSTGKSGIWTRAELVTWIEDKKGHAYTEDTAGHRADVAVRKPERGEKYVQTHADGVWTNNLLALAYTRR
jgi:hypothetical protein